MPWYAPFADAPDTHRIWADPGSEHERVLCAVKWSHEVSAPGSTPVDDDEPLSEDEVVRARALGLPVDDPDCPAAPAWVRSELRADDVDPPVLPQAPAVTSPRRGTTGV
jgi:hypothetical protein